MANNCVIVPKRGKEVFSRLKKELGYEKAAVIFNKVQGTDFQNMFKDTLTYISEGIPTYESIMNNDFVRAYIGKETELQILNNRYEEMPNTAENAIYLINEAAQFNKNNKNYIATVEYSENGIKVTINRKTEAAKRKAEVQYKIIKTNEAIARILNSAGVKITDLIREDIESGRVGATDFSKTLDVANGFAGLIRVANNMEGVIALSEEFSHLLVGIYRNSPLMQRSLELLMNEEEARKVLGEEYESVAKHYKNDEALIAEECLGKLLREGLINPTKVKKSLFRRLIDFILNKFNKISPIEYINSIEDIKAQVSKVGKEILEGSRVISQDEIRRAHRKQIFSALSEKAEKQLETLREAIKTIKKNSFLNQNLEKSKSEESKKNKEKTEKSKMYEVAKNVEEMVKQKANDEATMSAVYEAMKMFQDNIESLKNQLIDVESFDTQDKFIILRNSLYNIQTYTKIINSLKQILTKQYLEDEHISNQDIMEIDPDAISETGSTLILNTLYAMDNELSEFIKEFSEHAMPIFVNYLKTTLGIETVKVKKNGSKKLVEVSIEEALKESDKDLHIMNYLFNTMADSPDTALQLFDKVYKIATDNARLNTIEVRDRILILGHKYEKLGIKDYSFIYEDDKMNYINKEYDISAFKKAKKDFISYLDKKYGPIKESSPEKIQERRKEFRKWLLENTDPVTKNDFGEGHYVPKKSLYPSKYEKFTKAQKDFYDEWMSIKEELDVLLGPDATTLCNTIKIRRNGLERMKDGLTKNPLEAVKSYLKEEFTIGMGDELEYHSGVMGINGEEVLKVPLFFLHGRPEDSNDISTDAIGTLIAYAGMAHNYTAMVQVANPLEIGKHLLLEGEDSRKIKYTRGGKELLSNVKGHVDFHSPLYVDPKTSNFARALNYFLQSKIYGRYLKDEGSIKGIDVQKASSTLLKIGASTQLGFNSMADTASVLNGLAVMMVEASADEIFNNKELAKADAILLQEMKSYLNDVGKRQKNSKLALFDEMFDIKHDFKGNNRNTNFIARTILGQLLGPRVQYLGQDMGNHYLYNRTALAMSVRMKVYNSKTNKTETLWDALKLVPIDPKNPSYGNKLIIPNYYSTEDGMPLDNKFISDMTGKFSSVNRTLYGVYDQENQIAARQYVAGRFLMQYRDFMPTAFRYRFGTRKSTLESGGIEREGFYNTAFKFLWQCGKEIKNGGMTIPQVWRSLDDTQKANLRRFRTEMLIIAAFYIMSQLLRFFKGDDDDDKNTKSNARNIAFNYGIYYCSRMTTELTMFLNPKSALQLVDNPAAGTKVVTDFFALGNLFWPPSYMDEIQSGDYKGHSSAYRAFMKSPITLWYKTIKRNLDPEKATEWFEQ